MICECEPGKWVEFAFADTIRSVCTTAFRIPYKCMHVPELKEVILPEWGLTARQIMQRVGTKLREIDSDVFVLALERELKSFVTRTHLWPISFVISDVRYPNEANWITKNGGHLWWIERKMNTKVKDGHESERLLTRSNRTYDVVIDNNGSKEETYKQVVNSLKKCGRKVSHKRTKVLGMR
jgi:hypothetical protein